MPQPLIRHIFLLSIALTVLFSQELYSQKNKYWVYFSDKGFSIPSSGRLEKGSGEWNAAEALIGPEAMSRRGKTAADGMLLTGSDLPVSRAYINSIERAGGILSRESRWFNAASFYLSDQEKNQIASLPFVAGISPVRVFRGKPFLDKNLRTQPRLSGADQLDYGRSAAQLNSVNAPPLHALGITGKGVRVGLLDSGFRWKAHEALSSRNIISERDFIFNDSNTANEPGDQSTQDTHGTLTLSVIAGYMPGKLIGVSFDSEFLLGKTEYIPSETMQEEDNWVEAIEWMEASGVDLVSCSVGYDIFDDGTGYYWANGDFNGRTSMVARAAAKAAELGVLVCTSMGNEGNGDGVEGTLLTPADADSIISVGGAEYDKYGILHLWPSSSTGPTNDGRIKPDVVGLSSGVYHAMIPGPSTYGSSAGNSVSTPLVAGSAALVLSARPELTPLQVREALRTTAKRIDTVNHPVYPNNFLGWGMADAFSAALYFGPIFGGEPEVTVSSGRTFISAMAVSSAGMIPDSVIIHIDDGSDNWLRIPMSLDSSAFFETSGKYSVEAPVSELGKLMKFYITASDSSGKNYQSPPSILNRRWSFFYGIPGLRPEPKDVAAISLEQNFPNPFHQGVGLGPGGITIIPFYLTRQERVIIKVYNLIGEEVDEVANGVYGPGFNSVAWIPRTAGGLGLPTGVYFYRMSTQTSTVTKKMIFLR